MATSNISESEKKNDKENQIQSLMIGPLSID